EVSAVMVSHKMQLRGIWYKGATYPTIVQVVGYASSLAQHSGGRSASSVRMSASPYIRLIADYYGRAPMIVSASASLFIGSTNHTSSEIWPCVIRSKRPQERQWLRCSSGTRRRRLNGRASPGPRSSSGRPPAGG